MEPVQFEHFPALNCMLGADEGLSPSSELDTIVVNIIPSWWRVSGGADFRIGVRAYVLRGKETLDIVSGWLKKCKHDIR